MTILPQVDIVVPCFNEEACIPLLVECLGRYFEPIQGIKKHLIIINDGSQDKTLQTALDALEEHRSWLTWQIIDLSRNFGKEAALMAGLESSSGEALIILDADLQDPPELIPEMIATWQRGADVVNAVRSDRSSDGPLKQLTALLFYQVFLKLSKLQIQINSSDYRLLARPAIDAIVSCPERVRFSKGFFAWAGFRQENLYYIRPQRMGGSGKWNLWKLWNYALDGIFNFSTAPLRIWTYIGLTVTAIAFALGIRTVVQTFLFGVQVPGYASLFTLVSFIGGLQMVGIGIMGEYLGRIYIESKRRPLYVIRQVYSS